MHEQQRLDIGRKLDDEASVESSEDATVVPKQSGFELISLTVDEVLEDLGLVVRKSVEELLRKQTKPEVEADKWSFGDVHEMSQLFLKCEFQNLMVPFYRVALDESNQGKYVVFDLDLGVKREICENPMEVVEAVHKWRLLHANDRSSHEFRPLVLSPYDADLIADIVEQHEESIRVIQKLREPKKVLGLDGRMKTVYVQDM